MHCSTHCVLASLLEKTVTFYLQLSSILTILQQTDIVPFSGLFCYEHVDYSGGDGYNDGTSTQLQQGQLHNVWNSVIARQRIRHQQHDRRSVDRTNGWPLPRPDIPQYKEGHLPRKWRWWHVSHVTDKFLTSGSVRDAP